MRRRGISPVIATVILVAVAIAVAIAVAFWMTGIVGLFTGFEQLQIVSAYAEASDNGGWEVTLEIRNTGTASATIDNIIINGKPVTTQNDIRIATTTGATAGNFQSAREFFNIQVTVNPGESITLVLFLPSGTFSPGQSVEIKIHTASGKEYPKLVVLP